MSFARMARKSAWEGDGGVVGFFDGDGNGVWSVIDVIDGSRLGFCFLSEFVSCLDSVVPEDYRLLSSGLLRYIFYMDVLIFNRYKIYIKEVQ